MRRILPALLGFLLVFLITAYLFRTETKNVSAALSTHLVISEVQVAGVAAGNDFIELYNPTSTEVSLDGLRLGKRSSSGTTSASIVAFAADETVPAHGYYLWCNTTLNIVLSCDRNTSATVADNNSVALIDGPLSGGSVVDALTFGTVASPLGEGTSLVAPTASSSVERKANSISTSASMGTGGADEFEGNGEDSNNNAADFVSRAISQPQNSLSSAEIPVTPTPTPTEAPTPSPTPEPSASPTPSPTIEPRATPTPTLTPTPTIPAPRLLFRGPNISCSINYRIVRFFRSNIFWPFLTCSRT